MRHNNLSSSNSAIQEKKTHLHRYKKIIIILVQANADTLYALNKSCSKGKKVNLNLLTGNKNSEE